MKQPASGNAGGGGGAADESSLARAKSVNEFVQNLRAAARNPEARRRMSATLARAALYDARPRDHLREYAEARQPDRRLEPYLSELNAYAERLDNRTVHRA